MAEPKPRQRKFAPRSRTGCLTCRTRRKRCDNLRPECANCARLNLKCEWQNQRKIVPESAAGNEVSTLASDILDSLPASIDPWDTLPGDLDASSERKHLLQYYTEVYVPSVSVATTAHSFYISLYMPWAFNSEGMLNAIIALSSAQLSRRTENADRAQHLRAISATHQKNCHAFIQDRISPSGEPLADTFQVIGITLLLVGLEALNGMKSTTWLSQLKSVRRILNTLSMEQSIMGCWEVDSLRRHFTYHDAMASLMARVSDQDSAPLPIDSDLSPICALGMPQTIDPLMGLSYYLCALISRIRYVTTADSAFPQISSAAFNAIEQDIQSWTYDSPLTHPAIDMPVALDLIALAESYRLAALIQLYRHSEPHKAVVPSLASRTMEFISRIPPGSPADSSLLYPIFLAGAELEDARDIEKCYKRLEEIQKRNRYENVGIVQKVLEAVWRPTLNGEAKRDWEDVLKEWKWSFTLG